MADASTNITSLSISVEANTGKTASKLGKVAAALRDLNTALSGEGLSELRALSSALWNLSDAASGVTTLSWSMKKISEAAAGASRSIGNLNKKTAEMSVTMDTAAQKAEAFAGSIKDVGEASQDAKLPTDYSVVLSEINARLESLQSIGAKVADKLGRVSSSASKSASSTKSAATAAQSLKTALKELASNALTKSASAARNAIASLGDSVKSLFKSTTKGKSAFAGIEKLFRSIGRIAFYRMIRTLMKTITQGFKEGITNLYHYSEIVGTKFKTSMDKMATSALYVKNAFAAMAAPLINVVAPIIDMIGDKVAALANRLAEFFAALTGQGVYTKAIKYAKDYNDELKETAKRMERWLAGFDEINRMNDNSGSGSGSGVDYSKMFEEAVVSEEMSELARKIIEAFNSADLSPIGRALGEKLKNALDSIDWDKIKEKASKIARSITSFINGAMSVPDLGKSIGRTIAEALNTAVTFATTLVSTLNWKALGKQVGEGIRTFISTFGFEDVGTGINNLAMGILGSLQAAVDAVGKVNPENGLTGWEEIGHRIGKAISNIKFGEIIKTSFSVGSSILNGILDAVLAFLEETKTNNFWDELGEGIGNALASVNWIELIGKIADIGVNIVKGIFKSIKTAVSSGLGVDDETAGFIVDAVAVGLLTAKFAKLLKGTKALSGGFGDKNKNLSQQTELTSAETAAVGDLDEAYGVSAYSTIPALIGVLVMLKNAISDVKNNTETASGTISESASGTAEVVQNSAQSVVESFVPITKAVTEDVPTAFQTMGGAINNQLAWAWNSMQKFNRGVNTIPQNFKAMTDSVAGNLEISAKNEESYMRTESENWRKYNQNRANTSIQAAKDIRKANDALKTGASIAAATALAAAVVIGLGALARGRGNGGQAMSTWEGYDSGGYPTAGSLFLAGEGGHSPEYVGSFGNQTGVWNSDQLVQAMYRAVRSALAEVPEKENVIYLDGEPIYRAVVRKNNSVVRATGRSALLT